MLLVPLMLATTMVASSPGDCRRAEREEAPAHARPAIVVAQANCGPCQTSGPNKGKKRCCELVGGDWICRWVDC